MTKTQRVKLRYPVRVRKNSKAPERWLESNKALDGIPCQDQGVDSYVIDGFVIPAIAVQVL